MSKGYKSSLEAAGRPSSLDTLHLHTLPPFFTYHFPIYYVHSLKDYSHRNATTATDKPATTTSSSNSMSVSPNASLTSLHYIECDHLPAPRAITPSGTPQPKEFRFDNDITAPELNRDGEDSDNVLPNLLPATPSMLQRQIEISVEKHTTTTDGNPSSSRIPATSLSNIINSILKVNK